MNNSIFIIFFAVFMGVDDFWLHGNGNIRTCLDESSDGLLPIALNYIIIIK